ncbi:M20/M25/M40 family metallo-hydrolase [Candidatus Uhrbacteria bacterium]|jgi:succinyl-diaminopimelate desuccinylase|nr:M20/M25/M40 family metallo-hydrolase [Candidatus Uhrbacteria bacterium]
MDSLKVLEDLIAIRSDRHANPEGGRVEYGVAMFLKAYLEKNFPDLIIEEQEIDPGRVNLYVHDGTSVGLLMVGHMDTVEEGAGWKHSVRGERKGGRLYGRGAADMKAGLVAILAALDQARDTGKKGIAALFYCDEEYDFLGMKQFVKGYADRLKPRLVVCPEITQDMLLRGARGIIEFRVILRGKTGHAARPHTGIDAFAGFMMGVDSLREYLSQEVDELLGPATLNIGMIRCGALQGPSKNPDDGPMLGSMGNVIPDYCEATLEVRTIPAVTHQGILDAFNSGLKKHRTVVESIQTSMNLGSFVTSTEDLKMLEEVQEEVMGAVSYYPVDQFGYSDAQMLAEVWDVPTVVWGPKGKNMHGSDEYVEIPAIERFEKAYRLIVDKWE